MEYKELETMLREDEEKAAKFKQALESAKESGAKSDVEALVMAAAAIDCEFTPEQVEQYLASASEVSDDELDLVTGGEDSWCAADYNCFVAFLHESEINTHAACYMDYRCLALFH